MGASGYLAAKSEGEMAARQIAIEKEEIRLMPDLEEQELAIILEAKGLTPDRARETAHAMMADPQRALDTKVQEELGIQPPSVTPLVDGVVTGTATAFGALIPLIPLSHDGHGPGHLGFSHRRHAGALRGWGRPQHFHRPRRLDQRPRYVPGRLRRGRGRLSYRRPVDGAMNPVRSLLALLVGMGLFRLVVAVLETTLVGAAANGPVTSEAEYFAVRNQPAVLATALNYNSMAALLVSYVLAKIAGACDVMLAGVGAAIQTAALIWDFTAGEYAAYTPVWTRIALVLLTGPAMVAGAAVCARAARYS